MQGQRDDTTQDNAVARTSFWTVPRVLLAVFFGLCLYFFTPLPHVIVTLIPDRFFAQLLAPHLHTVTLDERSAPLDAPVKYAPDDLLPVLSTASGVCFSFYANAAASQRMTKGQRENARRAQALAEIIVTDSARNEYTLTHTEHDARVEDDGTKIEVVCQTFGRTYSIPPQRVNAVYIRPLTPLSPFKVSWLSVRDVPQR